MAQEPAGKRVAFAFVAAIAFAPACLATYVFDDSVETSATGTSSNSSSSSTESTATSTFTNDGQNCGGPKIYCAGECVHSNKDPLHCGGCYQACAAGQRCHQSSCDQACDGACDEEREICISGACECRSGLSRCDDRCVDLRSDAENCSECGLNCDAFCSSSECIDGACRSGQTLCDQSCVDTNVHPLHCGACDSPCPPEDICLAGQCTAFESFDACLTCPCSECWAACCTSPYLSAAACLDDEACP